jgi:hypothetical protein
VDVPGVPVYEVVEGDYSLSQQEQASFAGAQMEGYPISASSLALEQFHVITAGPARLFGFQTFNNKVSAQFIQLFDQVSGAPAAGAIPVCVFTVAASSNLPIAWPWPGRWFSRGIVIANSTTAATQTAGAADCFFDVQYFG